jgi:hypothetical protein
MSETSWKDSLKSVADMTSSMSKRKMTQKCVVSKIKVALYWENKEGRNEGKMRF